MDSQRTSARGVTSFLHNSMEKLHSSISCKYLSNLPTSSCSLFKSLIESYWFNIFSKQSYSSLDSIMRFFHLIKKYRFRVINRSLAMCNAYNHHKRMNKILINQLFTRESCIADSFPEDQVNTAWINRDGNLSAYKSYNYMGNVYWNGTYLHA